jgi:hypothetical protein
MASLGGKNTKSTCEVSQSRKPSKKLACGSFDVGLGAGATEYNSKAQMIPMPYGASTDIQQNPKLRQETDEIHVAAFEMWQ